MRGLQVLMGLFLIALVVYTLVVGLAHGWGLVPIFFSEIASMTWNGQFNLDFLTFLILSGLWVAWRNGFSAAGIALAVLATIGGMLFLSLYVLYLIRTEGANPEAVLLGVHRSR